jgi:hypothetical protein
MVGEGERGGWWEERHTAVDKNIIINRKRSLGKPMIKLGTKQKGLIHPA